MRTLLILILLLSMTSCALLGKRTTARYVPPAGCSERAIAQRPPPPPSGSDLTKWKRWAAAYVGAVGAFEDSENKRSETADCLDRHRGK